MLILLEVALDYSFLLLYIRIAQYVSLLIIRLEMPNADKKGKINKSLS